MIDNRTRGALAAGLLVTGALAAAALAGAAPVPVDGRAARELIQVHGPVPGLERSKGRRDRPRGIEYNLVVLPESFEKLQGARSLIRLGA